MCNPTVICEVVASEAGSTLARVERLGVQAPPAPTVPPSPAGRRDARVNSDNAPQPPSGLCFCPRGATPPGLPGFGRVRAEVPSPEGLGFPDVGGLEALGASGHLELDPVTLGEALEALSLDGAEVHENVLATLLSDESEALRVVEPLHCSLSHDLPLSVSRALRSGDPDLHGRVVRAADRHGAGARRPRPARALP